MKSGCHQFHTRHHENAVSSGCVYSFKISKNSCHNVRSTLHKSSSRSKYFLPVSSSRSFLSIISLLWTSSSSLTMIRGSIQESFFVFGILGSHNQTLFSKCFLIWSSFKILLAIAVFPKPHAHYGNGARINIISHGQYLLL